MMLAIAEIVFEVRKELEEERQSLYKSDCGRQCSNMRNEFTPVTRQDAESGSFTHCQEIPARIRHVVELIMWRTESLQPIAAGPYFAVDSWSPRWGFRR